MSPTTKGPFHMSGEKKDSRSQMRDVEPQSPALTDSPPPSGPRSRYPIISFLGASDCGSAVISPEEPNEGPYWTLIGSGPDGWQNQLAQALCDAWNGSKVAEARASQAEAENERLRGALRETLDVAEMFVPVDLDAPGFRRARAALSTPSQKEAGDD